MGRKPKYATEEERKAALRERGKRWREANLEKARECERRWREANREKANESSRLSHRKRYEADPEAARERYRDRSREWRLANLERSREIARNAGRRWREANPEKAKEKGRIWRLANPEKADEFGRRWHTANLQRVRDLARNAIRARRAANPQKVREQRQGRKQRRRARKAQVLSDFTASDAQFLREYFQDQCVVCGCKLDGKGHLDHWIPLSKGGGTTRNNMMLLCGNCNRQKNAKMPEEFLELHLGEAKETILSKVRAYFSLVTSEKSELELDADTLKTENEVVS